MSLLKHVVLLLFSTTLVSGEKDYENAEQICKNKCSCGVKNEGVFTIDCVSKEITLMLNEWPPEVNGTSTIAAVFSKNPINSLEPLPPTNATVIAFYDRCNITRLAPGIFQNTVNVIHVDLSHNLLKADQLQGDVLKGSLANTTLYEPIGIEHLNLAYNLIHSIQDNFFEHLINLKHLNLEGNKMRIIDQTTLKSLNALNKLEYLNLADNRLFSLPDGIFTNMNLVTLDLSQNEINFVPSVLADVSGTLKQLILDGNSIEEFNTQSFKENSVITEISAQNLKQLLRIDTNSFTNLPKLIRLDLSGMPDSVIMENEALINLTNLRELDLSRSNLNYLPINFINWSQLTFLDFRKNQFYCNCELLRLVNTLSDDAKSSTDAPYCYDFRRHRQYDMYTLTEDTCFEGRPNQKHQSTRLMRISVALCTATLIILLSTISYICFRKILLKRQMTFAPTVVYNPIITNTF